MDNTLVSANTEDNLPARRDSRYGNSCSFNRYVDCASHTSCASCGWNPQVGQRRIEAMKTRFATEHFFRIASGWR